MVEGFEWSNGDPITANDMVWTFNTVNDLGLLSNWETYYRKAVGTDSSADDYVAGIASLVAVNDYTVEITLNFDAGLSAWQYRIAQSPFLNETYWSQFATSREDLLAASGADAPGFSNTLPTS